MESNAPIAVRGISKVYGSHRAVDDLTFSIAPARVTGFLGPNGAGKTTTLRMLLGLARPTAGEALLFGAPYIDLDEPSRVVGALIDASGFHPGRRIRHELAIHAAAAGIDDARVGALLHEVGLERVADRRVGQLSLGMRQRLGLAAALLGDPRILVLDEPANGLDPAGAHWLRDLLLRRASSGTAILVSSHVLAELALFADDVVVLNHGRLVTQGSLADIVAGGTERVIVRSPQIEMLRELLTARGPDIQVAGDRAEVVGLPASEVGDVAAAGGVALHELRTEIQSLEEIFLDLTGDDGEIR